MSEIVNLRRARKEQARRKKSAQAEANRVKHGVPKREHDLAKARTEKAARGVEGHRLIEEHNDDA